MTVPNKTLGGYVVKSGFRGALSGVKSAYGRVRGAYTGRARAGRRMGPALVGGACFVGGTLVAMGDGTFKPIEEVQAGDQVLCISDAGKGNLVSSEVLSTTERTTHSIVEVVTPDGNRVLVTPEHLFYMVDDGWRRADTIEIADRVRSGMRIGALEIDKSPTKYHTRTQRVYNLEIKEHHNYLVTPEMLVVHNGNGGCVTPFIEGARLPGGDTSYILNLKTGRMSVGTAAQEPHWMLYLEHGRGLPTGDFVGGFARFADDGSFIAADLSSGTFSATKETMPLALDMLRQLKGR